MASATTALAVGERVVAAHDALQLGELAHHVGDEVGLGQQRGALGLRDVGAELGGDRAGQRSRRSTRSPWLPSLL
jgi:hypothetical protein